MHILHGTWKVNSKRFALWGEDTDSIGKRQKGKRGPHTAHPFALSIDHWLRYLDRFSTDAEPDAAPVTLLLPGVHKNPQPSPEAQAAGQDNPVGILELLPWEIDMVLLSATDALDFLLQLSLDEEHTGFTFGSDIRYWVQVSLLAMNCLVEQLYLPALEQQGSRYIAYWQPQIDSARLQSLASAMPPLCRALADNLATVPHPQALLDDFLRTTTDAFVRENYIPQRRQASPWFKALLGSSPILPGSSRENVQLFEAWHNWQSAAETGGATASFRVCLRMNEPVADENIWSLHYLLQATDDPSLLVDASLVWQAAGASLKYLERRFDEPQEKLLAALGVAARLFPPIERSLREPSPTGVRLNADEAYSFLTEALPLLEQNRFSVLVPNWWAKRTHTLKARAKLKGKSESPTGLLNRESLVNFQWEVSIGKERISRKEFEQLVALKQPIVRFRGEWVALSGDQVDSALNFFKKQSASGEVTLLDALKLTAPEAATAGQIEIDDAAAEGVLANLLERLRNPLQIEVPARPKGLQATLRPYQEHGFAWLVQMRQLGLGACLADDMGLGKTIQTITLWLHLVENRIVERPALLICPTSVVGNWRHEINRFAPSLRILKHQGADRQRSETFLSAAADVDVVLTSYALLVRDLDTFKQMQWSSVVLDEAQNIKNPTTKQNQAVRALTTDYRLALTGTPVENRLSELWSILNVLNPGYLGSQEAFRSQFSTPIERYNNEAAASRLKRLTAPFILRRMKTDARIIDDLPEKFENKVFCSLTPEQATLYEAVVRQEMEEIEEAEGAMQRRGNVLRMLTHLKQICNHPAHFLKESEALGVEMLRGRSGKLTRLTEMLDEIYSAKDRALIFTQYAEMGKHLQNYLREIFVDDVLFLHGATPAAKREQMVRQFQSPNGPTVFILSLKAGGTGLNLTHANNVFHFDRWYNPAVENQATDRAFRIGQTRNIQVHKFVTLGTLEERIDSLIEHKKGLAERIVGEGEGWISEMSSDELRELVALRHESIEELA